MTEMQTETRSDGWGNVLTGLGIETRDKRLASSIQAPGVFHRQSLDDLYCGDPMGRRICDLPANEQTRRWIHVSADEDVGNQVMQALQTLNVQALVTEAIVWSRLYGGAVILLGADDGRPPSEPLNESGIKSLAWANVLTRYELRRETVYSNPFEKNYGTPQLYAIDGALSGSGSQHLGALVHESRVIRFDGPRTPLYRRESNMGWCDSIFVSLSAVLRDFWAAFDGASVLLQDFGQTVIKIKGLADIVASDKASVFRNRMAAIDLSRSVLRATLLDADGEDMERKATPLAGLPEILDRLQQLLSAATEIPVTLLMGRSPAGMNATGDSDIRLFYDAIASRQENDLRPKLERLLRLVMLTKDGPTGGREPEEWSFKFHPLWQLTDTELAEVRNKQAQTDQIYLSQGVLVSEEVRNSRFGGDAYSLETTKDPEYDKLESKMANATEEPGDDAADDDGEVDA